jgi:hypothetical protein
MSHLRAVIGPWAGESPYGLGAVKHGFRDGLEPKEYWVVTERMRQNLQEINRQQEEASMRGREAAWGGDAPDRGSVLKRAMASRDAAAVFAEAAQRAEADPLTDPDVRLWVGLLPLEGSG